MGVKERLKAYIQTLNISEREFCRRIGVSTSYVNSIRQSIQPSKLEAITREFPALNPTWLLTGSGEMLNSPNKEVVIGDNNNTVSGSGSIEITNDVAGLIELQKGYQELLRTKDEQINRLITVLEKFSKIG